MAEWQTFFAAQVAASATLAGLLFVGVSLDLSRILADTSLPNRALAGCYVLLAILIVSSLMLLPGQSMAILGAEVLVAGIILWGVVTRLDLGALRRSQKEYRPHFVLHLLAFQIAVILSDRRLGSDGGRGKGILLGCRSRHPVAGGGVRRSWILLVEINR